MLEATPLPLPPSGIARRRAAVRRRRVLDHLPDLADGLDERLREEAAAAVIAPALRLEPGRVDLPARAGGDLVLVLDGVMKRTVGRPSANGARSAQLLGPGDLCRPAGRATWDALAPTEVAVLDRGFFRRVGRWPTVLAALVEQAVHTSDDAAAQLAALSAVRVDDRIVQLLRLLAERWGRVGPSYVRVELPLSHRVLADLVGAHRPSVTTAVGRLRSRGVIGRDERGWLLFEPAGGADGAAPAARGAA